MAGCKKGGGYLFFGADIFVIPEIFYRESTEEDALPSSVVFVSYYVFSAFLYFWGS